MDDLLSPALSDLVGGVKHWITFFSGPVLKLETYEWEGDDRDQFLNFLILSVIRRQYEAMVALVKMTESGYGHFAVTLLRPAYEEMIWLSYLRKQGAVSKELVVLLMRQELCDNLDAQNEYLGIKQMSNVGFSQSFIKSMPLKNKIHTTRLKEIGKSLNWREGSTLPSVAYLARAVGREKQYKYLYQGTSRYVHFSMQENMRRVWGQKGKVTIASSTFASYWSAFALSWGARIFFDVLLTAHGVLDDFEMTQDDEIAFGKWIESLPHVPIVTPEELKYWS